MARDALGLLASIDWSPILVALITVVGTLLNTALALWIVRQVRLPSGGTLGAAVEQTHAISHANAIIAQQALEKANGG